MDNNKLRIAIFYQGDAGEPLVNSIIEYIATQTGIKVEPEKVVDSDDTLKKTIYEKVVNIINTCDAAIAVLTLDEREASMAGNLWFEIGHWLGSKRRVSIEDADESLSSILLLQQKKPPEHSGQWPVEVITNLGTGVPARRFQSKGDVEEPILKFLTQQKQRKLELNSDEDNRYPLLFRVQDTLGCTHNDSFSKHMHSCEGIGGKACGFRYESIAFIAELLRMGRANRELPAIESFLFSIASLCEKIVATDYCGERELSQHRLRQGWMDDLYLELKDLDDLGRNLLGRENCAKGEVIPKDRSWERIKEFLTYRLQVATEARKNGMGKFAGNCNFTLQNVPNFCSWASEYLREPEGATQAYTNTTYYSDGRKFTKNNDPKTDSTGDEIVKNGKLAAEIAKNLRRLGELYFDTCRETMKNRFKKFNDQENNLSPLFHSVRENLPHNTLDGLQYNVWPRRW